MSWKHTHTCKGTTKKGKRCKNIPLYGGYCEYHQNQRKNDDPKIWVSYHDYIKSNTWRKKALDCKHARFWICALCGGKAYAAHHNSYKRLGEEKACDLTPLCKNCHSLFHEHHKYNNAKHKWERKTNTP